jgi:hypothetical protein
MCLRCFFENPSDAKEVLLLTFLKIVNYIKYSSYL